MPVFTFAEDVQDLTESIEQLNMTTTRVIYNDQIDPQDDGFDDCFGEDGSLNDDDGCSHEWKLRHKHFHTIGYREGITAGKEASSQEGFNSGFKLSALVGYKWGLARGISSVLGNLSDHMKEKLLGASENRDRIQKLYTSVQKISTDDALKIVFHSFEQTGTRQSHNHSEGDSHRTITGEDDESECNQLELFSEEIVSILRQAPGMEVNPVLAREMVG